MADDRFQDVGDLEGLSFPSPEHPAASVVEDDLIRIYYSSIQNQYTADTLLVQDEVDYDDSDAVIADDDVADVADVNMDEDEDDEPPPIKTFQITETYFNSIKGFEHLEKYVYTHADRPAYLEEGTIWVVVSILSGTGLAAEFKRRVLSKLLYNLLGIYRLRDRKVVLKVMRTRSTESIGDFARNFLLPAAVDGKKQTVILLSGDGGLVDIINSLAFDAKPRLFRNPDVVLLPFGTGNALYHSLHRIPPSADEIDIGTTASQPSPYVQSLRTLIRGKAKPLPIFRARFSHGARLLTDEGQTAMRIMNNTLYGAVVASYGMHSTLVADSDTPEYRKHGAARFGIVAQDLFFPPGAEPPHAFKARLTLNGQIMGLLEHGYILATLVSNLEQTFTISPDSRPFDGQLRVVHFGALPGNEMMEIMKAAYAGGTHTSIESVAYTPIETMRIDFLEPGLDPRWRRCCIDGLIVGVEEGGWMELDMLPESLAVVNVVARGD